MAFFSELIESFIPTVAFAEVCSLQCPRFWWGPDHHHVDNGDLLDRRICETNVVFRSQRLLPRSLQKSLLLRNLLKRILHLLMKLLRLKLRKLLHLPKRLKLRRLLLQLRRPLLR
jgi:hypothetical protein